MNPSSDWIEDCLYWRGVVLTGPDAHWCHDWDGLPVDAFTPEYHCCSCWPHSRWGRICNWFYMVWFNQHDPHGYTVAGLWYWLRNGRLP